MRRIRRTENGATAVEYALVVLLIAVTVIVSAALLGRRSDASYRCTVTSMAAKTDRC